MPFYVRQLENERLESRHFLSSVPFSNPIPILRTDDFFDGTLRVEAADLDGDSDLDIVATSKRDGKLSFLENIDGKGLFGHHKILATSPNGMRAVSTADIDGDGLLDVVAASAYSERLYFMKAQGNGQFEEVPFGKSGVDPAHGLQIGDLDGDLDLDVIVTGFRRVRWYENQDGMGQFSEPHIIESTPTGKRDLALADFDLDGDLDIATISPDDEYLTWFENLGGATEFTKHIVDEPITSAKTMDVADFDDDGDQDIILATELSYIYWAENVGEEGFEVRSLGRAGGPMRFVKLGDMNDDGHLDIASVTRGRNGDLQVRYNQGDQTFGRPQRVPESSANFGIDLADLDGDGMLDIVAGNFYQDSVTWHKNLGNEQMSHPHTVTTKVLDDGIFGRIEVVDVDGDGAGELIHRGTYGHVWFEANEQGDFSHPKRLFKSTAPDRYEFHDLNNNGLNDILFLNGDSLQWMPNQGGSYFSASHQIVASVNIIPMVRDVDGDGDSDLIFHENNRLTLLENDGSGSFQLVDHGLEEQIFQIEVVDVDHDNDLDFLMTQRRDFFWMETTEDGPFQLKHELNSGSIVGILPAIDWDDDNDLDIVVSIRTPIVNTTQMRWFENIDGRGDFQDGGLLYDGRLSGLFNDVDRDGDFDVVNVRRNSFTRKYRIEWSENQNGTFQDALLVRENADRAKAIDLDADGAVELLMGFDGETDVLSYDVDRFHPTAKLPFLVSNNLRVNDLDLDGDYDLIMSGKYSLRLDDGKYSEATTFWDDSIEVKDTAIWDADNDGDLDYALLGHGRPGHLSWLRNESNPGLAGDVNRDGRLDLRDLDEFFAVLRSKSRVATLHFDFNTDGRVSRDDGDYLRDQWLQIPLGDSNQDGIFDSGDLVTVFVNGEYEDGVALNSTFAEGDWNGDGEFDTTDLVEAFIADTFVKQSRHRTVAAAILNHSLQPDKKARH